MRLPSSAPLARIRVSRRHVALAAMAILVVALATLLIAMPERADTPVSGPGPVRTLALARAPYLGVACGVPNAIECGRVGLTVFLREPAARVEATIAGERVRLGHARDGARVFEGFVQRPGLISGALGVRPDRPNGRWWGTDQPSVRVHLRALAPDGGRFVRDVRVPLAPGYG